MYTNWVADSALEDILNSYGHFEVREILLSEVDRDASHHNNVRSVAIDKDNVLKIMIGMSEHQALPMVWVTRDDDQSAWVTRIGNHRVEAAIEEGLESIRCYCSTGWEHQVIMLLSLTDNERTQLSNSPEELRHIVQKLLLAGIDVAEIRKRTGLKDDKIASIRRDLQTQEELVRMKFPSAANWDSKHFLAYRRLKKIDVNLAKDWVQHVSAVHLSGRVADELSKALDEPNFTLQQKRDKLSEMKKDPRFIGTTKRSMGPKSPGKKAITYLKNTLVTIGNARSIVELGVSESEMTELKKLLDKVVEVIEAC